MNIDFFNQFFTPSGKPIKKVKGYFRVSTEEQVKGHSLSMQQNQFARFAEVNKFKTNGMYTDEGYTARNMKRPQLQLLLSDIKKKKKDFDAIVVWRIDRIVRNTEEYHRLLKPILDKYDVALLSVTENNDMHSPYGRYMRNTQVNNAELESAMNSIRTIANLKEKARQGHYPAKPPIGYMRDKDGNIIFSPFKEYVSKLINLYATGLYSDAQVAAIMRSKGFEKCTKKVVENVLTKYLLFYTGKYYYMDEPEPFQGKHEPLITNELRKRIINIRQNKTHGGPKINKHKFLYQGMLICPIVRKALTGEKQFGANNSGVYEYYRCHSKCDECPANCKKCISSTVIDDGVLTMLKSIELTKENIITVKENFKVLLNIQTNYDEDRKNQVNKQITRLKNKLNQLYDDKLDGIITKDFYIEKRQKYDNQIEDLTIEYAALSKTNKELIKRFEKVFELCEHLTEYYFQLSHDKKREFLKIFCSNFFYQNGELDINVKSAFATLFHHLLFNNDLHNFTKNEKWGG